MPQISRLTRGLVWTLYGMAAFTGHLVRGSRETEEENPLVQANFPAYYSPTTLQFMQEAPDVGNYSSEALVHIAKHFLSQEDEESWDLGLLAIERFSEDSGNLISVRLPSGTETSFYESAILGLGYTAGLHMKKLIEEVGTFGSAPFLEIVKGRAELVIGLGAKPIGRVYLEVLIDNLCLGVMLRHPYRLHQDVIHAAVDSKIDREIMKKIVEVSDRFYGIKKGGRLPQVNTKFHEIMEMVKNIDRFFVQQGNEDYLLKVNRIDDSQVSELIVTMTDAINNHALALQDTFRRYEDHEISEEEFNLELERLGGPENVLYLKLKELIKENYTEIAISMLLTLAPAMLYLLYSKRYTMHEGITRLLAYVNTIKMRPEPLTMQVELVTEKRKKMKPVKNQFVGEEVSSSATDSSPTPTKIGPKSPTSDQIKLFKRTYHEIVNSIPEATQKKLDKKALANTLDENKNDYFEGDPLVLNTQKLAEFIVAFAKVPSGQQEEVVKPYLFVEKKAEVVAPVPSPEIVTPPTAVPVQKEKAVLHQFQFIAPNPVRSYEALLACKSDVLALCHEIMAYADVDDENKRKVNAVLDLTALRIIRHGMVHREMFIEMQADTKLAYYRSVLNKLTPVWPLSQEMSVDQRIHFASDHPLYGIFQASNTAWLEDRSKNQIDSLKEGTNLIRARKAQLEEPNLSEKAKTMLEFEIGEIYKQLLDSGYGLIDEDAEAAIRARGTYAHPLF